MRTMPMLIWTLILISHEFLMANGEAAFYPIRSEVTIGFTENKGQVSDQNMKLRPDVLFTGMNGNFIVFFIKPSKFRIRLPVYWNTVKFINQH